MNKYIIVIYWNPELIPDTSNLENLLDSNFKRVKLTEDSYLIASNNSPVEIRNYVMSKISNISRIFVGEMKESAAWRNMLTDSEIIKQLFNND